LPEDVELARRGREDQLCLVVGELTIGGV